MQSLAGQGAPAFVWQQRFGGTVPNWDDATPTGIKEDRNGDVVVVGSFKNTVDFGGGNLRATPSAIQGADVFVAKYSGSTGSHIWSKRFGSDGNDRATSIAIDSANNVVVCGMFMGSVDFGGILLTNAGSEDIFVVRLNSAGTVTAAKRYGGTGGESCWGMALDWTDNVVLTGRYGINGTAVDFGGGALPLAGGYDMFIAKLTPTGAHAWSHGYGGAGPEQGNAVTVDSSGNMVVVGDFQNSVNFGGVTLTSSGGSDAFIAKYNGATGAHLWSRKGGGTGLDSAKGVGVDAAGSVVVTGDFNNSNANFGGSNLVSSNDNTGMFLAKYTAAGAHAWSFGFSALSGAGAPGYASGQGIAVDSAGRIVVAGNAFGLVLFGGEQVGAGTQDILLVRFSADGTANWAKSCGALASDSGAAVSIGMMDSFLATGFFNQSVDFGGGQMQSPGGLDGFAVKFSQ